MIYIFIFVFSAVTTLAKCDNDTFPPWFKFGVATSAYQVEGAWNVSGKTKSIWDHFTQGLGSVLDGSTGNVACDSYHQWKRDIEMLKELGVNFYRLSISWSRLLPTGFDDSINQAGRQYYTNVIDELLKNGIEPFVTLVHYDLPQKLQFYGGWTNPLVSDWFASYARTVFQLFGDKVKMWITIQEPMAICEVAYNTGQYAPGILDKDYASDLCSKHVLLAHAKAWRIYDHEFKPKYHGKVSIGNAYFWFEALEHEDESIAEFVRLTNIGRYSHPIYSKEGGWPPILRLATDVMGKDEGSTYSKLPYFTPEEVTFIKGTFDFMAINHYSSLAVHKNNIKPPNRRFFTGPDFFEKPHGFINPAVIDLDTKLEWRYLPENKLFTYYPQGLRYLIRWLRRNYGDLEFMITENGYATLKKGLEDDGRIKYIKGFLKEILAIINEDKVNVTGYTVWSLMDNFSWMYGYSTRFGLYEVDFMSPNRTRTPRKSSRYYAEVIRQRRYDVSVA